MSEDVVFWLEWVGDDGETDQFDTTDKYVWLSKIAGFLERDVSENEVREQANYGDSGHFECPNGMLHFGWAASRPGGEP
jgi:hypothetical protein